MTQPKPDSYDQKSFQLEKELMAEIPRAGETVKEVLLRALSRYLAQAAMVEHLLGMQYLFASFSMKKYPEEFADYVPDADPNDPAQQAINHLRLAQVEAIRRWDARILFVARQEMTHLAFVQNLYAILGDEPYLFRPNFPVPAPAFPFGKPVNLMPFSRAALEVFRYWEKPDTIQLPDPFRLEEVPQAIRRLAEEKAHPEKTSGFDPKRARYEALLSIRKLAEEGELKKEASPSGGFATEFTSIEQLYAFIEVYFELLLNLRFIEGQNFDRVVNEHFGFNIQMEPIVDGKYFDYVQEIIGQIIEEGEGVGGVPPPLGSHFWVYQTLLDELAEEQEKSGDQSFEPALPVVPNPTISLNPDFHLVSVPGPSDNPEDFPVTPVTNPVAIKAMTLFNRAYQVLINMLFGFFNQYSIDQTTGIRPPEVNAFFRSSFYPFMTMVIRPLGEMVCRLPADAGYQPGEGERVPPRTAGPNFFLEVMQGRGQGPAKRKAAQTLQSEADFIKAFNEMAELATQLAGDCQANGYHMANYQAMDARDFPARFTYLAQNLGRIAQNFEAYWKGEMIAPIPSKGFQNFSDSYN